MADMTPEEQREWDQYQAWLQQVRELKQNQHGLKEAIEGGKFWITPDAGRNAAEACRRAKVELNRARTGLRFQLDHTHLGDCEAGRGLAGQLNNKYVELVARLTEGAAILENMAVVYEAAARAYRAADETNTANLQGKR